MSDGRTGGLAARLRAMIASRSGKGLMATSVWQLSNYVIPLATFPYLARVLGVEGFGLLGLGMAIMAYATMITDWGFDLTATQAVAQTQHDKVAINRIIWTIMLAKGGLAVLCSLAIVIGAQFYGPPELRPVLWAYLSQLLGNVINVQWALRGVEAFASFVRSSILGRLISLPLVFVLVHTENDAPMAALVFGLGIIFMGILNQWTAFRMGLIRWPRTSLREVWHALKDSSHVFGATSAISLYTNTITVALGALAGPVQVGLYSGADRIRKPVSSLLSPITLVFFPRMNALRTTDPGAAEHVARRLLLIQGGIALALTLTLVLFAPLVVRLLLGEGFSEVVPILRVMAWIVFVVGVSTVLGTMIMLPFGMKKSFTISILSGAATGLLLMFPLIHFFGAMGAAITSLASEIMVALVMLFALRKRFSWLKIGQTGHG